MRSYEFTERAARDLESTEEWYSKQGEGLGREFVDAVVQAIDIARGRPFSCPEIERGVRGIRCTRFPYRVHFEVLPDRIDVLAVYHTARDPHRWNDPDRE